MSAAIDPRVLAENSFSNLRKNFCTSMIRAMTKLITRIARPAALAATAATGLLATALTAAPTAVAATESTPPECVRYYAGWRYTSVENGCDVTVAVTVEYADGQVAPCRVLEPGAWATFAGYGSRPDGVTGLRTCDPGAV
ncbi:alpha-amylase [Streptomyces sp. NPDC126499]|uniref:alpha-amylase n=1 Tax=Streptomyces sp. NPDC126499 TaxID=3155314 RepID=UPI003320462C